MSPRAGSVAPRRPEPLRACLLALVLVALAPAAPAQVLPFRTFGPREGLPHENVAALFEDSHGFLWVGTWEGLARFDGASFTTYGVAEGLTSSVPFAIAEDERGDVWFEVHGTGIARLPFAARARPDERRIRVFPVGPSSAENSIEEILFLEGRAWVASSAGLDAMTLDADRRPRFERRWRSDGFFGGQGLVRQGERVWILSPRVCLEIRGEEVSATPGPGEDPDFDVRGEPGPDGRFLLWTRAGLVEFTPPASFVPIALDLPEGARVKATAIAQNGTRWIGTTRGLFRMDEHGVERLGRENGLPSDSVSNLHIDRAGHLWIGTHDGGIAVLAAPSPVNFLRDGEPVRLSRLVLGADGRLLTTSAEGLFAVEARGLAPIPGTSEPPLVRTEGFVSRDRTGEFWIGSPNGLYLVPGPAFDPRGLVGPVLDGSCAGPVNEDARGRLWASTSSGVHVREPGREFELVLAWPDPTDAVREVFVDRDERVWLIGWRALWRRTGGASGEDARLDEVRIDGAQPQVRAMLQDSRGRLWLGLRAGGLAWTDEPLAAAPRFGHLRQADGLPSDTIWSLAEAGDGALWIGTGRGLARLDPPALAAGAHGALTSWTSAEGLAGGAVFHVLCTPDGLVWAATSRGVARVDPDAPAGEELRPTVFVQGFEAAGEAFDVSEAGERTLAGIALAPDKNSVHVYFGGVDLLHGDELRFQTRLAGGEWSAPARERSLHLARLEPGDYRVEVRALAKSGLSSAEVASVEFRVLAPVWRRPWFLALAAAALALAVFGLHRARLARVLALQRVRAEIAGDLHDEVGSGLAQISILSEVARREAGPEVSERLGEVAELARSTRASMSDLVWAIRPEEDRLEAVVARMQAAAEQVLEPAGVELAFRAPPAAELARASLGPEARRQLLLFFKEALTNVARHARAEHASVVLAIEGSELCLALEDDGCGFDLRVPPAGHGLASLGQRAQRLGGRLELDSEPGRGTRVVLVLPL